MDALHQELSRDIIILEPVFHEKIWGGRRLAEDFGYDIPEGKIGECWAISAHPHGDCVVASGAFVGEKLSHLWDVHHELFGDAKGDRFPLLIKILDAHDDLSVQVHPDDSYAAEHEHGSLGKRECWYVLDAEPDTDIIIGQRARNRQELAQMIDEGRWDDMLNLVPIHKGDFFRIDPGTIHAIKGGTLILETQQSSDVTYRVYDYDRVGADGKPRELHIQQSLDVVNYDLVPPVSGKVAVPEVDGVTELMACDNFVVKKIAVCGEKVVAQPYPFLCVSVIEGTGSVQVESIMAQPHTLHKGSHFIAPAQSGDLTFSGDMTLIVSHLPHVQS